MARPQVPYQRNRGCLLFTGTLPRIHPR